MENKTKTQENIKNLSESQLLVRKKHLNFDLEKFMNNRATTDAAVLIVTPYQYVMTECFIKRYYNSSNYTHEETANAIYSSIYDNYEKNNCNPTQIWYDKILNDGNICFQLCSGCFAVSIMGFPNTITQSQYDFLVLFNDEIKRIHENNKKYFDENPMIFVNSINGRFIRNNIDSILEELNSRIENTNTKEETIIGSNIKELNKNLNSKLILKKIKNKL